MDQPANSLALQTQQEKTDTLPKPQREMEPRRFEQQIILILHAFASTEPPANDKLRGHLDVARERFSDEQWAVLRRIMRHEVGLPGNLWPTDADDPSTANSRPNMTARERMAAHVGAQLD